LPEEQLGQRGNLLAKTRTPSTAELQARKTKQIKMARAQILRRLLTATTDEEKQTINLITKCIKFMHQNYDIEGIRVSRVY